MASKHDSRRGRTSMSSWVKTALAIAVLGCLVWIGWGIQSSQQKADDANSSANALADQVTLACAEGAVEIDGRDICQKAKEVKKDVAKSSDPIEGPQGAIGPRGLAGPRGIPGPAGDPGRNGEPGAPGSEGEPGNNGEPGAPGGEGAPGEPGSEGEPGSPGEAGAPGGAGAPGAKGEPGSPGSKGEPGSKGDKGEKGDKGDSGPPGPAGQEGKAGRGIQDVTCTADGDWLFTFTDDTSVSVDGPCRITASEPADPPMEGTAP